MGAATLVAGKRCLSDETRGDERVGVSVSCTEPVDAFERVAEAAAVADDADFGFHKPAKLSARSVSESWGGAGRFRREGG